MIPLQMLLAALLGWLEREQRDVIAFLREENRALKAQLGRRRLRLNDDQRRRLAALGLRLGHGMLREVATGLPRCCATHSRLRQGVVRRGMPTGTLPGTWARCGPPSLM